VLCPPCTKASIGDKHVLLPCASCVWVWIHILNRVSNPGVCPLPYAEAGAGGDRALPADWQDQNNSSVVNISVCAPAPCAEAGAGGGRARTAHGRAAQRARAPPGRRAQGLPLHRTGAHACRANAGRRTRLQVVLLEWTTVLRPPVQSAAAGVRDLCSGWQVSSQCEYLLK
jgi:hypothetical protein